jgi:hypothetical protein
MLCYFYRRLLEKQIDQKATSCSLRVKAHLSKCPKCNAFYDSLNNVEKGLAASQPSILSASQIENIKVSVLRNLPDESNLHAKRIVAAPSKQLPIRFPVRSIAAVLIAAALIGIYLNRPKAEKTFVDDNLIAQMVDDSHKVKLQIIQFAKLPEQPIQNELQRLTSDIKSTLIFLKNCTPQIPPEIQIQNKSEKLGSKL